MLGSGLEVRPFVTRTPNLFFLTPFSFPGRTLRAFQLADHPFASRVWCPWTPNTSSFRYTHTRTRIKSTVWPYNLQHILQISEGRLAPRCVRRCRVDTRATSAPRPGHLQVHPDTLCTGITGNITGRQSCGVPQGSRRIYHHYNFVDDHRVWPGPEVPDVRHARHTG